MILPINIVTKSSTDVASIDGQVGFGVFIYVGGPLATISWYVWIDNGFT